jgi:hypothetical protein
MSSHQMDKGLDSTDCYPDARRHLGPVKLQIHFLVATLLLRGLKELENWWSVEAESSGVGNMNFRNIKTSKAARTWV